jgi:hypothetical protein
MDKFGSVVDRMYMKLWNKLFSFLRIKTQLYKSLQCVIVVDGANRSQKDGVEGNGGFLKDGAETFMLFLHGAQLVLRPSVLTVLDLTMRWMSRWRMLRFLGRCCLGKVDLLVAGGAAEVLLVSLTCPLPLLRTHPPSFLACCFFVFAEMGATNTASGRLKDNLLLSEKRGGKSHFSACGPFHPACCLTKQDPREPVLLMALMIIDHAAC